MIFAKGMSSYDTSIDSFGWQNSETSCIVLEEKLWRFYQLHVFLGSLVYIRLGPVIVGNCNVKRGEFDTTFHFRKHLFETSFFSIIILWELLNIHTLCSIQFLPVRLERNRSANSIMFFFDFFWFFFWERHIYLPILWPVFCFSSTNHSLIVSNLPLQQLNRVYKIQKSIQSLITDVAI